MKIPFEHTSVVGNQIFNIIIHPRIGKKNAFFFLTVMIVPWNVKITYANARASDDVNHS